MSLSAYERETIITFSDADDTVDIYTASRPMMTKLDKLCKSSPELYRLKGGDSISKTYICSDKNMISLRSKKVTRELSEEEKQAARERMAENFKRKSG